MLEEKQTETIRICDRIWSQDNNIEKKRREKRINYGKLAFEITKRKPDFKVRVMPLVISIKKVLK